MSLRHYTYIGRYILKQVYRNGRPFIKAEEAHFNISFSCISYLNSCSCFLPQYCTDQEMAAKVLEGFHGLQLYANQFWFKHVLTCCSLYYKSHLPIPNELLSQLQMLLQFWKEQGHDDSSSSRDYRTENHTIDESNDSLALGQLPREIRKFTCGILEFRKALSEDGSTQKAPDGIQDFI